MFRKLYPVVTILVAIHVLLYAWMNFLPFGREIYSIGVGYNAAVATGEFWRLATPIFLHLSFGHMLFNSFSLVIFGPALEQMLGRIKFISAYIISGVVANIATFFIGGLHYPPHLGASGAIFGLLGIYVYIVLFRKDLIDRANAQLVVTLVMIGFIMTYINTNINMIAHLFGFICGLALSPIILQRVKRYTRSFFVSVQKKEISFDPLRWKKKERAKKIFWAIIILFVIFGVIAKLTT